MGYARAHFRLLGAAIAVSLALTGSSLALSGILTASASGPLEPAEGLACPPTGGEYEDVFCIVYVGAGGKYRLIALNETVLSEEIGAFTMASPGLGISIKCNQEESTGKLTTTGGKTTGKELEVTFTACSDTEFGETCGVRSPSQSTGTISAVVNVALAQSEGAGYVVFTPVTGKTLFMIEYVGEECPLTEISPAVEGEIAGETGTPGSELSAEQPLVFSKSIAEKSETGLTFGEGPFFLDGEAAQKLASGDAWGIA